MVGAALVGPLDHSPGLSGRVVYSPPQSPVRRTYGQNCRLLTSGVTASGPGVAVVMLVPGDGVEKLVVDL